MSVSGRPKHSASRLLRALRVAVFFAVSPLYLVAVIIVILVSHDIRRWYPLGRLWADHSLRWFRIRVEADTARCIEPGRDYVLLCNHRSHFDIFALFASLPHTYTRWVAKRELEKVPLFGYALKISGQILVDRNDHSQAIDELRRHLGESGLSVVFFAEGQRSDDARLMPFKKGGAAFAIDAGLPLVPIAIAGSERVLPKHSLMVSPGTITVKVGEPIETRGLTIDDREALTERARSRVEEMLEQLEPSEHRDQVELPSGYSRGAKVHG
jgi:1-acyl-sn-glycerol-3-phosphate acyltransferase